MYGRIFGVRGIFSSFGQLPRSPDDICQCLPKITLYSSCQSFPIQNRFGLIYVASAKSFISPVLGSKTGRTSSRRLRPIGTPKLPYVLTICLANMAAMRNSKNGILRKLIEQTPWVSTPVAGEYAQHTRSAHVLRTLPPPPMPSSYFYPVDNHTTLHLLNPSCS